MPVIGVAQDDVLTGDRDEEPKFKAENFGQNYIDLRQPRFLYSDYVEYKNRKFYDHLSVGIVWHYDKIYERIEQGYDASLNYGVFVEKELNRVHALRLLFYEGTYQQAARSIRMNKYQMELLHSFNWTRFFGGYNPYRKIEAVTNLGLGGFVSERLGKLETGPLFIMGAGAHMQLSPLFNFSIEPYVALAGDGIDHSGVLNYRKYDVLYGTDVSLSYMFHNEIAKEDRKKYSGNTFVDFGLGVELQSASGYMPSSVAPLSFFSTAGPQLKLGVGHWLSPGLGIRVAGNLSSSNWANFHIDAVNHTHHPAYDIRLKNVLASARLDFLINPYWFVTSREDNLFGINAIVGWEYGRMIKTAYNPGDLLRTNYDGFSGGLQFRYNYDRYTALYLEPRLTLANYIIPYAPPYEQYVSRYRDYLFSLAAGLEFATNGYRFLPRKQQPSKFAPHMAVSLQGGPNYMFVTREHAGDFYMDYSAGLAAEVQMTPYSGIRVMADYSQVSVRDIYRYTQQVVADNTIQLADTALTIGRYGYVNLSADYVFDLGTLLQGYYDANRWDVAFALGLVSSRRVSHKAVISSDEMLWEFRGDNPVATVPEVDHRRSAKRSLGVQFGIPVSYRITPSLDLLFEPRARFFPSNYMASTHSQGLTKILNAQVGLRYAINERYFAADTLHFNPLPGHFFAHAAVGAQTPQTMAAIGPRVEAGVGYWFNPGIAARASLNFTSHDWRTHSAPLKSPEDDGRMTESSLRQMNAGGRLDLLLNPHGYVANRYETPFGLHFLLGWEYGMMLRGNMTSTLVDRYNAFTHGLQLRYNADGFRTIYLEPRYLYNLTAKSSQYTLVAGMELGATEYGFRGRTRQPGEFIPSVSVALQGGVGYIHNGKEYTSAPLSDFTGGIAAEYNFSPYSGVRLTGTYTNYRQRGLYAYHHGGKLITENLFDYSTDYIGLGLDYMLDITTLLQGYTPERRWNAALAIGPSYAVKVAHSDPAHNAGYIPVAGSESRSPESYGMGAVKHLWGAQVGVPVSFRVDQNWSILFEPRGKAFLNHPFNKRSPYPFVQYDALLGAKYSPSETFYSRVRDLSADHSYRHDFANFAVGSQNAAGTGLPFGSTGSVQLGLGVGRWMNALWGVRFGAEMASSHLHSVPLAVNGLNYDLLLKSARFGARADLMVNPVALSERYTPKRWGTALVLGWEMGGKIDAMYTHLDKHFYSSLSLGAQLRYHTDEHHALYFEPRYAFSDRLVSLVAGLEFATSEHRFRSGKNQPYEFKPYYSVGLAGGVNYLYQPTVQAGMPQMGGQVGVSGEYHFTPYSGVRLTAEYAQVSNGMEYNGEAQEYNVTHVNTGIDYTFDLSTLFAGYTPNRRMDVLLAAGPVLSTKISAPENLYWRFDRTALGMQLGIPVQYRISSCFGVTFEPRAQLFRHNIGLWKVAESYALPYATLDGDPNRILNLQLGVKYTPNEAFRSRMETLNKVHGTRYDFVNFALGAQYAAGTDVPFGPTGGLQLGLGYGRWANSLLEIRFGAEMAASHLRSVHPAEHELLLKSARFGARGDVMVNPLAMNRLYAPGRWGTALLFGWEVGGKVNAMYTHLQTTIYNSLSFGAQLRYHTDERHALYFEPRYTIDDHLISFTAGLEFATSGYRFRSSKNQPVEFKPYWNMGVTGGVNHLFLAAQYAGAGQLDFDLGLTSEYHFTPYSGARLTFGYSHLVHGTPRDGQLVNYGIGHLNTGADYMLDLSTLFAGYTSNRRMGVSLAAGPVFSARVAADKEYARDLKNFAMGVQLGIPVQFRLTEHLGISLEPRARLFGPDYAMSRHTIGGFTSKIFNLQMGIKCTF